MRRIVYVLSLGFACLAGNSYGQWNNNYYFSPLSLPNYTDISTVKATELVNEEEIITVGYAQEPSSFSNDIVIVKTKASSGSVIWAYRYGLQDLDERAYGLDVSYDGKHVIVVGTAQDKENPTDWNALAMKVEISSANVVWSVQYGTKDEYQELRMIEKAYDAFSTVSPTYFMMGYNTLPDVKAMLYSVSIFDDGSQDFGFIYHDPSTYPNVDDLGFTMVRNPDKNFIVTGTRYEDFEPWKIFTIGISPFTGKITDKYIDYSIEGRLHFEGAICNIDLDGFNGYGLAFSTRKPGVETGIDAVITRVILDKNREPLSSHFYWQPRHQTNFGLSIYQSVENKKMLDIYTGIYHSDFSGSFYNPGFLNTHFDGWVNYFFKYNVGQSKYALAMEQNKLGYTAKALHRDGENGFLLASLAPSGKTDCFEEQRMKELEKKCDFKYREYGRDAWGEPQKREVKWEEIHGKMESCDGTNGQSFKHGEEVVVTENAYGSFSVYPNPLAPGQNLQLAYTVENNQRVDISIYNALGQQVHRETTTLVSGSNQVSLDATTLSTGVNLIVIRCNGKLVYQNQVIKE